MIMRDSPLQKEVFKKGQKEGILERELRITSEYKTNDGMKLVLKENRDGKVNAYLEEDLELYGENGYLENLVDILKIITDVEITDKKYIFGTNSEEGKKLVIELKLKGIKTFTGIEKELLEQIKLYRNLQKTLKQRMEEIQKERLAFPKCDLDDIDYFTHIDVEKRYKRNENLLEVSDFLRALYAHIEIKTGIKREEIISNSKTREVVRERAIIAYLLRNRFDFLSYRDIGNILGKIKPKNHVTIMVELKKIRGNGFSKEFYKKEEIPELYEEVRRNYFSPKTIKKRLNL